MARSHRHPGGGLNGFMTRGANLKENFVLALEQNFPVVDAPGHVHDSKRPNQILGFQTGWQHSKIGVRGGTRQHSLNKCSNRRTNCSVVSLW